MVLMNASKSARNACSIANSSKIYGIMGGTGSSIGKLSIIAGGCHGRFPNCNKIPLDPVGGLAYMKANNLLSVNPQATGMVGAGVRMRLVYGR